MPGQAQDPSTPWGWSSHRQKILQIRIGWNTQFRIGVLQKNIPARDPKQCWGPKGYCRGHGADDDDDDDDDDGDGEVPDGDNDDDDDDDDDDEEEEDSDDDNDEDEDGDEEDDEDGDGDDDMMRWMLRMRRKMMM